MGVAESRQRQVCDRGFLRKVALENERCQHEFPTPRTVLVPNAECSFVTIPGRDPIVTMSMATTADAILHFAGHNARTVCALNFANGMNVGGGYLNGAIAQEEDLCRRMPALYQTLRIAKEEGQYPYGPSTSRDLQYPARYSDVLFTPPIHLARKGDDDRFEFMPEDCQCCSSLVSAAAPNLKHGEMRNKELLRKTMASIFNSPKLKMPGIAFYIVGAWGCGAFANSPDDMAELFAEAIVQKKLGKGYEEVHFAIPTFGKGQGDCNYKAFKECLRRWNIPFDEIEILDDSPRSNESSDTGSMCISFATK